MSYGWQEMVYAKPFAEALAEHRPFREWLLQRTKFADVSIGARLLKEDIEARRSSKTWWRSNFTEKCRCEGCSGQETDILGIFEAVSGFRFALHIEVKHPTDTFKSKRDQAKNYAIRAACWVNAPPPAIIRHDDADTMLLFDSSRRHDFAAHCAKFGSTVTFDEIRNFAPHAVPTEVDISRARCEADASKLARKVAARS